ncbi:MAG: GxxExxY protein [Flexibacter sp. CG_4_10_14_3_um_filter_32_15]|nr:MAG: GxxExxY protein [Flexibacter sp. CG_4_10_14_3_um_filter_32_15]
MKINQITEQVIGSCIEVHKSVGMGLLESVYEECLFYELSKNTKLFVERQKPIEVIYKDVVMPCGFRADFVIENKVILEIKSVTEIHPIHKAQLMNYLKLANCQVGLLINFNVKLLRNGITRWGN